MKFDKERWNSLLPYEKLFSVAGLIFFFAIPVAVVLKLLGRFGILSIGFEASAAVVGLLLTACQACEVAVNWRTNREKAHNALFYVVLYIGLGAILAIIALFVNL